MTKQEAEHKALETSKINNRPFGVVPVTYSNGEQGWDVTPTEYVKDQKDVKMTSMRETVSSTLNVWIVEKHWPHPAIRFMAWVEWYIRPAIERV